MSSHPRRLSRLVLSETILESLSTPQGPKQQGDGNWFVIELVALQESDGDVTRYRQRDTVRKPREFGNSLGPPEQIEDALNIGDIVSIELDQSGLEFLRQCESNRCHRRIAGVVGASVGKANVIAITGSARADAWQATE